MCSINILNNNSDATVSLYAVISDTGHKGRRYSIVLFFLLSSSKMFYNCFKP
jgi:hypothetical protein